MIFVLGGIVTELANKQNIEKLLAENGFSFKKSLGQNFLIDSTVCPAMAAAACNGETGVLEIGPGIGVLTKELSAAAKRVVAIELDERLKPVLNKTLAECGNVKVIFGDALKLDLKNIIKTEFADCTNVAVCANLPYYITSPVIMRLLNQKLPLNNITVMVQKEAAERLCAAVGTRQAGAVTVAVEYFSKAEIVFEVKRSSFLPAPNVDSAVIKLNIRKTPAVKVSDEAAFFRFVKACFLQRRKTMANTLANCLKIDRQTVVSAIEEAGINNTVRAEALKTEELAAVFENLLKKCEF